MSALGSQWKVLKTGRQGGYAFIFEKSLRPLYKNELAINMTDRDSCGLVVTRGKAGREVGK